MVKRYDVIIIKNNMDDFLKLKGKIDEVNAKVVVDDDALFELNGRYIKFG